MAAHSCSAAGLCSSGAVREGALEPREPSDASCDAGNEQRLPEVGLRLLPLGALQLKKNTRAGRQGMKAEVGSIQSKLLTLSLARGPRVCPTNLGLSGSLGYSFPLCKTHYKRKQSSALNSLEPFVPFK